MVTSKLFPPGLIPRNPRLSFLLTCVFQSQDDTKVLSEMGKEFDSHDAVSTGIVVDERKLLFVYADAGGALRQMQYVMNHTETYKGGL